MIRVCFPFVLFFGFFFLLFLFLFFYIFLDLCNDFVMMRKIFRVYILRDRDDFAFVSPEIAL